MESPKSPPSQATQTVHHSISTPTQTINSQSTTTTAAPTNPVVAIPVVHPLEGQYVYVFVKGSLYSDCTSVFGLDSNEAKALAKRYNTTSVQIDNGIMIKTGPAEIINALAQLGYKVVCSTGEAEITWTLQREV
jgi:hypothetical protein